MLFPKGGHYRGVTLYISKSTMLNVKATIHQATFRQFIAYNGCKQQIACKFQATRKQLVAYNTCTLTLKWWLKFFVCY